MNRRNARQAFLGLLTVLLMVLLSATPAAAQSLDEALDRGSFSPSQRAEIVELFADAEEAAIPRALLLPRLAEGIAKKVPQPRILAALRDEASALLEARAFLREIDADGLLGDQASWARAANLLATELSDGSIGVLARTAAARPQTFRPASALLVSLVEWGLSEVEAAALAAAAAVSDIDPSDYPVVVEILAEGRIRRITPEEIVERLLETLPEATSARSLRRSVLR